ncbi:MAG: metallophosphoesterase [Oscillospiraceae bacterium]|jgi:predicted phosphohydrolase
MGLYAIGDLHLSLSVPKPMDVFGPLWENYVERIKQGFSSLGPDDVTVLCGDSSWGMNLEEARQDLLFIDSLPGKKLILKGNHDYWWTTAAKMRAFFAANGIETIEILHNNCHFYGDYGVCGTRGWFLEESPEDTKVLNRELIRLRASLGAAGEKEKLCFLHYPPKYEGYECPEIIGIMREFGVKRCFYGHLHGNSHRLARRGEYDGIDYTLVSADFLRFKPYQVL